MRKRKYLSVCCCIVCAASASAGFELPWGYFRLAAAACCLTAWFFLGGRYPSACLVASVATAAAGILSAAPFEAMFLSAVAALAAWDLERAGISLASNPKDAEPSPYVTLRLRSLGATLAAGTAGMCLRYFLKVKLNFYIVVLLVAAAAFFFDRLAAFLARPDGNDGETSAH